MVDWQLAILSASIGVIVAGSFRAIGWFFKKGEQESIMDPIIRTLC